MTTAMDGHLPSIRWSPSNPRMVTHQKEVYYIFVNWHLDLTQKLTPGDNCHGWSPTIPRMVTHQPKVGQLYLDFDSSAAKLIFNTYIYVKKINFLLT